MIGSSDSNLKTLLKLIFGFCELNILGTHIALLVLVNQVVVPVLGIHLQPASPQQPLTTQKQSFEAERSVNLKSVEKRVGKLPGK